MNRTNRGYLTFAAACAFAALSLAPAAIRAQDGTKDSQTTPSAKGEQWIHVRVKSMEDKEETVRVNVPIEMAIKVLPCINKDKLHNGKVDIDDAHLNDVNLRAMLDAVRTSKDGEYVTVQSHENNVRIAKNAGYLYIHVTDNSSHHHHVATKDPKASAKSSPESKVEIKVPMKVVDALLSAGKDELDIIAALRALSANGDTELVSVKDEDNTVRVWIDSKNLAD